MCTKCVSQSLKNLLRNRSSVPSPMACWISRLNDESSMPSRPAYSSSSLSFTFTYLIHRRFEKTCTESSTLTWKRKVSLSPYLPSSLTLLAFGGRLAFSCGARRTRIHRDNTEKLPSFIFYHMTGKSPVYNFVDLYQAQRRRSQSTPSFAHAR